MQQIDPIADMELEQKKAAVELDKFKDKARDFIERQVRERYGKGDIMPLVFYPADGLTKRIGFAGLEQKTIKKLAKDMLFTMYATGGVGLAAPQVGVQERMFVCDWSADKKHPVTVYDPMILWSSEEVTREREGCLSMPGAYVNVTRAQSIEVRFKTGDLEQVQIKLHGWAARIFQHEYDHLEGVLMLDHAARLERRIALKALEKIKRGEKARPTKKRKKRR